MAAVCLHFEFYIFQFVHGKIYKVNCQRRIHRTSSKVEAIALNTKTGIRRLPVAPTEKDKFVYHPYFGDISLQCHLITFNHFMENATKMITNIQFNPNLVKNVKNLDENYIKATYCTLPLPTEDILMHAGNQR